MKGAALMVDFTESGQFEVNGIDGGVKGIPVGTDPNGTVLIELPISAAAGIVNLEIENLDTDGEGEALTDFIVEALDHPKGSWYETNKWAYEDEDPSALAPGEKSHIRLPCFACYAFRFKAVCEDGNSRVKVRGSTSDKGVYVTILPGY
jgi:hypothetical protein